MTKNEMTVSHIVTGSLERYTIPIQQANKHSDTTCVKLDMNYANPSNYLIVTSAGTPTETIKLDNVSLSNKLISNHINPHHQMSANARSIGCICNNATIRDNQLFGQPTEGALLRLASQFHALDERAFYTRLQEWPFSSESKLMVVKCVRNNQSSVRHEYH
ncbi:unnamed protein product [Schistosoma mattheei]|uniref:Uncharacterized protein n=1 Tax=Schistosoma mattheei TaxID=31246 RepID=A0A183NJ87_9TREM|nr:unnamed protein product [Schistosoma mattheei]